MYSQFDLVAVCCFLFYVKECSSSRHLSVFKIVSTQPCEEVSLFQRLFASIKNVSSKSQSMSAVVVKSQFFQKFADTS